MRWFFRDRRWLLKQSPLAGVRHVADRIALLWTDTSGNTVTWLSTGDAPISWSGVPAAEAPE